MPRPNDDPKTVERRGTSSHKGGRGITNNGVPRREPPETNLPGRAGVDPVIPGRLYKAKGQNIGRADSSQRGIGEGLSQVVDAYKKAPGSQIVITGGESPSVKRGDPNLPIRRAEAFKRELVKRGVPPDAIRVEASPPSKADPRRVTPEEKASMRGAVLEVVPPKRVPYTPKGFTDGIYYVEGKKKTVISDLTGPLTLQIGISGTGTISGLIVPQGGLGIAIDTHGNVGTYSYYGAGGGIGGHAGVNASVQFSNAQTIYDLSGPFTTISAHGGEGVGGSADFFAGSSASGPVIGGGITLGASTGASVSVTRTTTEVYGSQQGDAGPPSSRARQ